MVVYRVFSEPVLSNYYSRLCSSATIFLIIIYCLILIPPAFIAYATNDLWLSVSSYREKPNVLYLNQCIVLLGEKQGFAGAWSSLPEYLTPPEVDEQLPSPNITFSEMDTNSDGKNDQLDFSIDFSSQDLNITSLQLLLFFRVSLSHYSSVTMESVIHVSLSWSSAVSSVWVGGDVVLNQRTPLSASGRSYEYESLVNTSGQSWKDYQLSNILSNYNQRDLTTVLFPEYHVWEYDTSRDGFSLQMDIKYTEQTILYRPSFWERLKWAWIQYLAISLLFWYIMKHVQSFVFQNHIVATIKHHSD